MKGGMKYIFKADTSWKMAASPMLFVTAVWDKDCGALFEKGKRYLVYAQKRHTSFSTGPCEGNKLYALAHQDRQRLGVGMKTRFEAEQAQRMNRGLLIVGVLSLLFLLFVSIEKKDN